MVLPVGNENQGSPAESAPSGKAPAEGTQPEYVTREDLAVFQQGLQDLLANNYRGMQSQNDKYMANVQRRLDDFESGLTAMRASGMNITEEQERQARQNLMLNTLAERQTPNGEIQEGEGEDPYLEAYRNTATAAAERLMKTAGIEISDEDPEVAEIIEPKSGGTVEEYLDAVAEAIEAKRKRTAAGPNVGQMPSLTGRGAPVTNQIQDVMDPNELWNRAREQGRIR